MGAWKSDHVLSPELGMKAMVKDTFEIDARRESLTHVRSWKSLSLGELALCHRVFEQVTAEAGLVGDTIDRDALAFIVPETLTLLTVPGAVQLLIAVRMRRSEFLKGEDRSPADKKSPPRREPRRADLRKPSN
jgi:hypothetical protein